MWSNYSKIITEPCSDLSRSNLSFFRRIFLGCVLFIGPWFFSSAMAQVHPAFNPNFGDQGVLWHPTFGFPGLKDMMADDSAHVFALIHVLDDSNSTEASVGELIRFNSDGVLDPAFGAAGRAAVSFPGFIHTEPVSVTTDSSHRLYILGLGFNSEGDAVRYMCMTRLLPNGVMDTAFGDSGLVKTRFMEMNEVPVVVALDLEERILMGGATRDTSDEVSDAMVIARYTTEGLIDSSFGSTGKIHVNLLDGLQPVNRHVIGGFASSIHLDSQGRIIIGGAYSNGSYYDGIIIRMTEGGKLDKTFNQTGFMAVDPQVGYNAYINEMIALGDDEFLFSMTTIDPHFFRNFTFGRARLSSASYETQQADFFGNADECTDLVLDGDHIIIAGKSARQANATIGAKTDYAAFAQVDFADLSESRLTTITLDSTLQYGAEAIVKTSDGKLIAGGFESGPIPTIKELMFFELNTQVLGVPKATTDRPLRVFPNPATDHVYIPEAPVGATYSLFDPMGRVVFPKQQWPSEGYISLQGLSPGSYLLSLEFGQERHMRHVVKQ